MTNKQVLAVDEDIFMGSIQPPTVQTMGQGRSALWTMPLVAAQYQPVQSTPEMRAALQAQQDGRFVDALILLEEAGKTGKTSADAQAEMNLLRASFWLQGNQTQQALEILAPLFANPKHAADAYSLTAMALLQQGKMQEALAAAQHAHGLTGDFLSTIALSYALQGLGRLDEARDVMHDFNGRTAQSAIALAREAELALTLDQIQAARGLVGQAHEMDATHPYVNAVSGLVYLIDGNSRDAIAAFETALKRDPKDARALLGQGLAEVTQGNYQSGLEKLQAANEADPGNALILTYLGRVQQQLGQSAAAMSSWHQAQQADTKDPIPWLYQSQMELQSNHPKEARESLRQAQARTTYRSVYRGARLLNEDEQLLQDNLAEAQRQSGLESLAFYTLSDTVEEKNSASLRSQAEILQGKRFGESARRSLLLQSQFNDRPGNLPTELDIYGDGAGQTGAATPQHGVVSGLNSQQTSYNNYDGLFARRAMLEVDAISGSQNSAGAQIRLGAGSDTLGVSLAHRQYQTDGNSPFENLNNHIWQGIVQWRPTQSTQLFVSRQSFDSLHGETAFPADPFNSGAYHQIEDGSSVTRLGLRHSLDDNSELRGLISSQKTDQIDNFQFMSGTLPYSNMGCIFCGLTVFPDVTNYFSSEARSVELQYRRSGAGYATQWGVSSVRSPLTGTAFGNATLTNVAQQIYADWQQTLNPYWQVQAGLAWGKNEKLFDLNSTYLQSWQPKLGLVYTPDNATHVRLAAWKNLDDAAVGNASLAPASLAGIVLNRPGDTYKLVQGIALGADKQMTNAWLLEGQAQRRWTEDPYSSGVAQAVIPTHIDESRLALHWQPGNQSVNVTLAYDEEYNWKDPANNWSDSVIEQHLRSLQLGLRWLASEQWTANLACSHNRLSATQQSSDASTNPILLDVQDHFNQTDASLNWRFNRVGSVDMGVRNATNMGSQYTEADPLVPRFSKGRLIYAKFKLVW